MLNKSYLLVSFVVCILLFSCRKMENKQVNPNPNQDEFVRAADMSFLPLIESEGTIYKHNFQAEDPLLTLKNAGCNTIRIRLWNKPVDEHAGLAEVKAFAERVRKLGLKLWLTVHYSDTWADPAHQTKPSEWQNLSFQALKDKAIQNTDSIVSILNPDIIQIGNEINDGLLWPDGKLSDNEAHCLDLLQVISHQVRLKAPNTKIMLHYAGIVGAESFFNKMTLIDYDYIGLSYYPIWHGKDLNLLQNTINQLGTSFNKKVLIAETAYPFTLGWDDWTDNIVGTTDQLIDAYPATPQGQKAYLIKLKTIIQEASSGIGLCYWGAEWVSFRGPQAKDGSSFENQALWDFQQNALPVMEAFNKE